MPAERGTTGDGQPVRVWAVDRFGRGNWTITQSAQMAEIWRKAGYDVVEYAPVEGGSS